MNAQPPEPDRNQDNEDLEAEITAARDRLADDVAALAAKADVPKQVKAKIDETRSSLGDAARSVQQQAKARTRSLPTPARFAIPAAAVVGLILLIVSRKRRSRR